MARRSARRMMWVSPGLISLVQYRMLLAIAVLLYLLFHGASPELFVAAFVIGAMAAALPSIVYSGVLPWKAARRIARLRWNGIPGSVEVLPPKASSCNVQPILPSRDDFQVPVRVYPTGGMPAYEALMAATPAEIGCLAPGMCIPVLIDPTHTELVLYAAAPVRARRHLSTTHPHPILPTIP